MTTPEQIIAMLHERRSYRSPIVGKMLEIRDHYNGDVSVPLTELDRNEKAAVANLITQGLDQTAMRISSVTPSLVYPPTKPGNPSSERYARICRLANYSWWQQNRFVRKQRKRARWLIGYSSAPVILRPDPVLQIPHWELRDPLNTFAAPTQEGEELTPPNVIFVFKRSYGWLRAHYPDYMNRLAVDADVTGDEMYEVVEYVDDVESVQVVVANAKDLNPPSDPYLSAPPAPKGAPFVEIERVMNLANRCPAVIPTRTSLDRPMGQFDGMPGLYAMQARAMALWLISSERAVFPDTWFISRPNETVTIIKEPDGRAGIPGQVKGGDLKEVSVAPPPSTAQIIDLLERNQRVTSGIPSDFGGESASNVRTGKRADSLLTATVDFWVQEAQETLADSYMEENKIAVGIIKAYFGSQSHSFYVNWPKAQGQVDYIPNRHFQTDNNIVAFPQAGSDVNALIIGLGQRVGIEEMSIRTAQERDPLIDDPELEHDRVMTQQLEKSLLTAIDQAIASGQLGPVEVGRITELVATNKVSVWDAINTVHKETQQLQQPDQGGDNAMGGQQGGLPNGQGQQQQGPGIMAPGIQQSLGTGPNNPPGGAVATPAPSIDHMGQLFSALRARKVGTGNQ